MGNSVIVHLIRHEKTEANTMRKYLGWTDESILDIHESFHIPFQSTLVYGSDLKRCVETNLVLSLEKSHFMVQEGVVLGHVISSWEMDVDKAKIKVISSLPPLKNVKGVRSFLGHAGFYRRFIKNFSVITKDNNTYS